ncbi:SUN domain-containing protein 2-like isoform X2 [Sphaeramia orbicularis]|uniref:SUN domain-containing protein 2-like isoform X2 n=1 Tax=Sphaeramia orbicularis TaxID=375764 RepID=UPI00117E6A60|nr:SUN domain-containing protein 2-like isoform X2 [Sphaeramia orbicularis]
MIWFCDEDLDVQSWGWTDLSSYSSLVSDCEQEQQVLLQTSIMSRRSLRLDDGLLDRGLPHASSSFSSGGVSWRNSRSVWTVRSLKPRPLSTSCSDSLLVQTPRKPPPLLNSSVHSVVSDTSLLSSLLDESSIQETTLLDSFWGLDQDCDPKESTVIEQSAAVANSTLTGSDGPCVKHPAQTQTSTLRLYCKDCDLRPDRKELGYCSSSKSTNPTSTSTTTTAAASSSSSPSKPRPSEPEEDLEPSTTIYSRDRSRRHRTVHSSHCTVMSLKERNPKDLPPAGSLCKRAADVFRRLRKRWHHLTMNVPLTRSVWWSPLGLLLFLILLLFVFGLCWFGPAALQSVLSLNITEPWSSSAELPLTSSFTSSQSQTPGGATDESTDQPTDPPESTEVQMYTEPLRPPPTQPSNRAAQERPSSAEDSSRLVRLEESLSALWARVEAGGQRAERRHAEVLQLYADLSSVKPTDHVESWVTELLERQLTELQTRLDQDRHITDQTRQQDLQSQRTQVSRLDRLELDLLRLTRRTEELQQRRDAAPKAAPAPSGTLPSAVSAGVDRQSHDALLSEVTRLETALENVRREVKDLSGCGDGCRQLSTIQDAILSQVSTWVQEEVRVLVYGNQLAVGGGAVPESLLQWLSSRYVSGADLQEALSSLERSILKNVSVQLEHRLHPQEEEEEVLQREGATGGGVTEEVKEVRVIVQDALRLFSQDRTGLADFALESGGGSILSTRCSQTYETKAALLSLFGVPLWYFSQSPRAAIQPDVHPGNCWAFRGSTGFLVIRLSMRIRPTAFSLEHIPKSLAPSGTLRSAPKDFSVYGLDDDTQDRGTMLGSFTYDQDGEAVQTFVVTEDVDRSFQIIEVQVLSNWGHDEYTCLYRFRVHGTPADH